MLLGFSVRAPGHTHFTRRGVRGCPSFWWREAVRCPCGEVSVRADLLPPAATFWLKLCSAWTTAPAALQPGAHLDPNLGLGPWIDFPAWPCICLILAAPRLFCSLPGAVGWALAGDPLSCWSHGDPLIQLPSPQHPQHPWSHQLTWCPDRLKNWFLQGLCWAKYITHLFWTSAGTPFLLPT